MSLLARLSAGRRARRRERGAALLLVLVLLVVAWSAALLFSIALSIELRSARAETRRLELVALADSALAESLAALALDPYAAGLDWHELGRGEISAEIEFVDHAVRDVRARARTGGAERTLAARVALTASGPQVFRWRAEMRAAASAPFEPEPVP